MVLGDRGDQRPPEDDERAREAERLRQLMPRAFVIGAFLFPCFLALELPTLADFHEVSWTWPVVWRLFGSLVFLIGALAVERKALPLGPTVALGSTIVACTAAAAGCVSWKLGGYASDITDGMAFYFVGIATLLPTSLGRSLVLMMPTYLAYFGVIIALDASTAGHPLPRPFIYDCVIQLGICLFGAICSHILWSSRQQLHRARRLGRYRLESLVTRGAASEVWRATEQLKGHVTRRVALKIVRAERSFDRDLQARFEREARAASALTSEHTIRIYDFGASDDGLAFLAMEPLEGTDLASHVRVHGPLEPRRAIHVAEQVALSLIEAHRRGIVHGDIKPSNVFVIDTAGREDTVKVLDWGLARGFIWRQPTVTNETLTVGTPAFMAPEAFTGTVGARSDVYAFGATLYWLLTARHPVDFSPGDGPWTAHRRAQLVAPSIVRNRLFPAGLDSLVLQCLAKEPELRPHDMEIVLEALRAIPVEPWSMVEAADLWARVRANTMIDAASVDGGRARMGALSDTEVAPPPYASERTLP